MLNVLDSTEINIEDLLRKDIDILEELKERLKNVGILVNYIVANSRQVSEEKAVSNYKSDYTWYDNKGILYKKVPSIYLYIKEEKKKINNLENELNEKDSPTRTYFLNLWNDLLEKYNMSLRDYWDQDISINVIEL